jgi:hypothetical protein
MSLHAHSAGNGILDEYGHGSIWKYLNLLRGQALLSRQHTTPLSVATAHVGIPSSNSGEHWTNNTSQLLSDIEIPPPPTGTTETAPGTSALPKLAQELVADPGQNIFSPLDLSVPDIPFLPDPDWNAVINGCLNDDTYGINPSYFANSPC